MCVLCGELWTEDHWSEVALDDGHDAPGGVVALEVHVDRRGRRLRERWHRARLVGLVLGDHGLQLQDWEGSSYILRDRKGNSAVVHDLPEIWRAAERMTGQALDPLDPAFLAALGDRAGAATE